MHGNRSYSLSLIDNYPHPMWWDRGRGKEFAIALRPFEPELAWDHIHYRDLIHKDMTSSAEAQKVLSSDGLILSGSSYNLSEKDVRERFEHIAELVRRYEKPILGICFGHQLLASAFGFSIRPMRPEYIDSEWWEHTQEPALLTVEKGFPLIDSGSIWVEFSHHEEIQQSKKFNRVFKV